MNANGHGVPDSEEGLWRTCPTRVLPGPPLIAHQITGAVCQKRQREYFHKCWSCAYSNRRITLNEKAANGVHANGATVNGVVLNGAPNGHAANGHATNGHATNGVAANGAPAARPRA